jgi:two-component system, cell cycle response regulator
VGIGRSEGALVSVERLRARVAALAIRVGEEMISVTISIGVALRHPDGDTPGGYQERADSAMYAAKTGGRCRVALAG